MHPFSLNDEELNQIGGGFTIAPEHDENGLLIPPITSVILSEEGGAEVSAVYGEAGTLLPGEGFL